MSDTITAAAEVDTEDDDGCTCGCWCGDCPCAEDEDRAAEYGDDTVYYNTAHCCECGASGPECEYHCTCR